MRKILTMAAFVILAAGAARADTVGGFYTGNDLHRWCNYDDGDDSVCLVYIVAAAEALSLEGAICLPARATTDQTRDIVTRSLRDHPEKRDRAAIWLVRTALAEVWPCP